MPLRPRRNCAAAFVSVPLGSTLKRLSPRDSHCRPVPRCALPSLNGWIVLAISCGVGVLSRRPRLFPDALRGAPASFLTAAFLRPVVGTVLQPVCDAVLASAPAGVALLLLTAASGRTSSDNRRNPHGTLTIAFAIGAIGAAIGAALGAIVLTRLLPPGHAFHLVPSLAAPLAGAFAATYIGGSLNFIAVVAATGIGRSAPHAVAAALSADLLLMAAYFGALFVLASRVPRGKHGDVRLAEVHPAPKMTVASNSTGIATRNHAVPNATNVMGRAVTQCVAPAVAWMIFATTGLVARTFALGSGADVLLVAALALVFRTRIDGEILSSGSGIADLSLLLFFAALGGCVTVSDVGVAGLPVALLCCCTLLVHALFMFLTWKMTKVRPEDCLVASNANIGGPTTAAAFAAAEGWGALVGPAAFVGAVGYAVATPVALLLSYILQILL